MKKKIVSIWIVLIIALFLVLGVYKLDDGEEAVITRFGEYNRTEIGGGLKWMIPIVDKRYVINTSQVRRMEFGYKTVDQDKLDSEEGYEDIASDSLMITGDENIVNVMASIQYRIVNARDYLFRVNDPEGTLNVVAVSTIRRSVANNELDDVLADNKNAIMLEIRNDLQSIADNYGLGIQITQVLLQDVYPPEEVDDAFKDIVRAQLDKESRINEAVSYENKIIPAAKGDAAKQISDAEAYKSKRINEAKGDVASFKSIYDKYKNDKEVTRTRLYLETLQNILGNVDLVITDGEGQVLKFLPLSKTGTVNEITEGGN